MIESISGSTVHLICDCGARFTAEAIEDSPEVQAIFGDLRELYGGCKCEVCLARTREARKQEAIQSELAELHYTWQRRVDATGVPAKFARINEPIIRPVAEWIWHNRTNSILLSGATGTGKTSSAVFVMRKMMERRKLRDIYMHKSEALIHGDLHTSNFFVSQDQLKAIDMEISCMGPVAFDLGYLQSHLLSQFACSVFRPFDSEEQRLTFIRFILSTMEEVFTEYFRVFFQCWDQDAKPIYQGISGLQEYIEEQVRKDMIGFCSSMNIFRCASIIHYPEYDDLTDPEAKRNATLLSMLLDHRMILRREEYQSVSEWVDDIASVTKTFLAQLHE
ncbi:MAG: phosphotransferase [Lentisphaeria bacterium]|nr:phosphotransferase [Lentisphaeria bacterium]